MITTGEFTGNICPVDQLIHGPGVWVCEQCGGDLRPVKFSVGFGPAAGPVAERPVQPWWLCPNDPPCGHAAALHDVEDFGDPSPRCCFEGCTCGAQAKREATDA